MAAKILAANCSKPAIARGGANPESFLKRKAIYDRFYEEVENLNNEEAQARAQELGSDYLVHEFAITAEKVAADADARVKKIFENLTFLRQILDRHEATIQKRWQKKTIKARREIIIQSWHTKMPLSHRPDFEALEGEGDFERLEEGTKYHNEYLLPYINEEDLTRPRSLLLLMSTRARCHPSALAAAEHAAHGMGDRVHAFRWQYLLNHCMDLADQGGDQGYGKLWNQHDDPDMYATLGRQAYAQPFYGLLVLEAQDRVLSFLVKCAKLILHDYTEDLLLQSPLKSPVSPIPDTAGFASLAALAAEAPYRQPANLDFARLATLLAAKRDEAADHLWSLREDPGYFEAHMLECKEHCVKAMKDVRGRQLPRLPSGDEDVEWASIVGLQIEYAFSMFEAYSDLHTKTALLHGMQQYYADGIDPKSDLPELYTSAILDLRYCLKKACEWPVKLLMDGFCASPQMRQYFARSIKNNGGAFGHTVQIMSFEHAPICARIFWLLGRLFQNDEVTQDIGLTNIIDELQRLMDIEEPSKSSFSAYLKSIFSDLAIVSECIHQLELYQPWEQEHERLLRDEAEFLEEEWVAQNSQRARLLRYIGSKASCDVMRNLAAPTQGRFAYPVGKRRTRENTERMRNAEQSLDDFWNAFDKSVRWREADFAGTAIHDLWNTHESSLQRTPVWVEPDKKTELKIEELYIPFSRLLSDSQGLFGQNSQQEPSTDHRPKAKIKTRGIINTQSLELGAEPVPAQPEPVISEPHFAINYRALKVFKTVFFTPSVTATPGEVTWVDFRHAMDSVGFASEKLRGSAWQFSSESLGRSIQFHDSHPSSKIPYRTLRRHGRRLYRAFGWRGEMFSLAEKVER